MIPFHIEVTPFWASFRKHQTLEFFGPSPSMDTRFPVVMLPAGKKKRSPFAIHGEAPVGKDSFA